MELSSGRRRKTGRRTGRTAPPLSKADRRRLIQLGVSLLLFLLALAGRSVFPEHMERWQDALTHTTDFKAAFLQLGEATAQGEPVLDAMGKLLTDVFAEGGGSENRMEQTQPSLVERGRTANDRIRLWVTGTDESEPWMINGVMPLARGRI